MKTTLFSYISAADWWTKKQTTNTIRGSFNWDLLFKVIQAKVERNNDNIGVKTK